MIFLDMNFLKQSLLTIQNMFAFTLRLRIQAPGNSIWNVGTRG